MLNQRQRIAALLWLLKKDIMFPILLGKRPESFPCFLPPQCRVSRDLSPLYCLHWPNWLYSGKKLCFSFRRKTLVPINYSAKQSEAAEEKWKTGKQQQTTAVKKKLTARDEECPAAWEPWSKMSLGVQQHGESRWEKRSGSAPGNISCPQFLLSLLSWVKD